MFTLRAPDSNGLSNPTGRTRVGLAFLLAMLGVLGPLNIDMYLPGLPGIAADLSAGASYTQLSLTACLVGLALGQMVVGPISDARGRRGPLLVCVTAFAVTSVLCAVSPTILALVAARFTQGFAASAGLVLSRAVARDVFCGAHLTRFYALLMVINATAPLVAPVAGGAVLLVPGADWRAIFAVLAAIGLIITAVSAGWLPETLPALRRIRFAPGPLLRTVGNLLTDRRFLGHVLIMGAVHGGSFAYVAGTPFIYQDIHRVSPQTFSILFGVNGLAIILGSHAVGRWGPRLGERQLLRTALVTATIATAGLVVTAALTGPLATLVVLLFVYMTCMGVVLTSVFSLAMADQAGRAGTAGALLGAAPMLIGAGVAPLVGLNETSAVPMALVLAVTATIGLTAYLRLVAPAGTTADPVGS